MPTLRHNGARLFWEAAGPDGAPVLLFLHAGIATSAMWDLGEHDTTAARAQAEHLAEAVDGSSLHVFPGTAHMPSVEYPQPFLGLLREWLTGQVAG